MSTESEFKPEEKRIFHLSLAAPSIPGVYEHIFQLKSNEGKFGKAISIMVKAKLNMKQLENDSEFNSKLNGPA